MSLVSFSGLLDDAFMNYLTSNILHNNICIIAALLKKEYY